MIDELPSNSFQFIIWYIFLFFNFLIFFSILIYYYFIELYLTNSGIISFRTAFSFRMSLIVL